MELKAASRRAGMHFLNSLVSAQRLGQFSDGCSALGSVGLGSVALPGPEAWPSPRTHFLQVRGCDGHAMQSQFKTGLKAGKSTLAWALTRRPWRQLSQWGLVSSAVATLQHCCELMNNRCARPVLDCDLNQGSLSLSLLDYYWH